MSLFQFTNKSSSQLLGEAVANLYRSLESDDYATFQQTCLGVLQNLFSVKDIRWKVAVNGEWTHLLTVGLLENFELDHTHLFADESFEHEAYVFTANDSQLTQRFLFLSPTGEQQMLSEEKHGLLLTMVPHLHEIVSLWIFTHLNFPKLSVSQARSAVDIKAHVVQMSDDLALLLHSFSGDTEQKVQILLRECHKKEGFIVLNGIAIHYYYVLNRCYLDTMPVSQSLQVLSAKEIEVCFYFAQIKSNEEIALHLGVTKKTVENHLVSIYKKMGKISRSVLFAKLNQIK